MQIDFTKDELETAIGALRLLEDVDGENGFEDNARSAKELAEKLEALKTSVG